METKIKMHQPRNQKPPKEAKVEWKLHCNYVVSPRKDWTLNSKTKTLGLTCVKKWKRKDIKRKRNISMEYLLIRGNTNLASSAVMLKVCFEGAPSLLPQIPNLQLGQAPKKNVVERCITKNGRYWYIQIFSFHSKERFLMHGQPKQWKQQNLLRNNVSDPEKSHSSLLMFLSAHF